MKRFTRTVLFGRLSVGSIYFLEEFSPWMASISRMLKPSVSIREIRAIRGQFFFQLRFAVAASESVLVASTG